MTIASSLLTRASLAFTLFFLSAYTLVYLDTRLFYGVSVWEKPSKFFLSLAIHMATLAWGISLLPAEQQRSRGIRRRKAARRIRVGCGVNRSVCAFHESAERACRALAR